MGISPDERRKIYEEEKARIETEQKAGAGGKKEDIPQETSLNLAPRLSGFLCYLGVWVTGIIFFIIEQKNRWVRFHAAQSIVTFGTLFVASSVLGWMPFVGGFFSAILSILGIVLWIVLMVKAFNGETYRVPWAADVADMMLGHVHNTAGAPATPPSPPNPPPGPFASAAAAPPPPAAPSEGWQTTPPPPPPAPPFNSPSSAPASVSAFTEVDKKTRRKIDDWFSHKRQGNITGSAFAIAFSIIVLIFFNFFYQYVAYYTGDSTGSIVNWTREPFFTNDIKLWLPLLNTALAVTIIAHIVMIIFDSDLLKQGLRVIMDGFGLAVVTTLLVIFPFNFDVIPDSTAATGTNLGVHVVLVLIAVGFGISLLVKFIQLLVSIGRAIVKGT
jgi:uncharacterized membrane protein